MAWKLQTLATKPDNLSALSRSPMVDREDRLWLPHKACHACIIPSTQNKYRKCNKSRISLKVFVISLCVCTCTYAVAHLWKTVL